MDYISEANYWLGDDVINESDDQIDISSVPEEVATDEQFNKRLSRINDMMQKGYFKTASEMKDAKTYLSNILDSFRYGMEKAYRDDYPSNLGAMTDKRMEKIKQHGDVKVVNFLTFVKELADKIKEFPIGMENRKDSGEESKFSKYFDALKKGMTVVEKDRYLGELDSMWGDILGRVIKANPRKPKGQERTMAWANVELIPNSVGRFTDSTASTWRVVGLNQEIQDATIIKDLVSRFKKVEATIPTNDEGSSGIDKVINWIATRLMASIPEIVKTDSEKIIRMVGEFQKYKTELKQKQYAFVKKAYEDNPESFKHIFLYSSQDKIEQLVGEISDDVNSRKAYEGMWDRRVRQKNIPTEYIQYMDVFVALNKSVRGEYSFMDGIGQYVDKSEKEIVDIVTASVNDKMKRQIDSAVTKIKQRNIVEVVDGEFDSNLSIFYGDGFHWTVKDDKGDDYIIHFRAIWAGGYNIQPLHIRSIITIKKNK